MASITSSFTLLLKSSITAISTKSLYGFPRMSKRSKSEVKWSMKTKQPKQEQKSTELAAVTVMWTRECTGLPFGLSNNLLGWILLGVFGLIWSLYFTYTSSLDEDDDSGLSL